MLNCKIINRRKRDKNWRITIINTSKIKYINVVGKVYSVTKISFFYMTIDAVETNLTAANVPEDELWDISFFEDYKIRLINNGGQAEIVNFEKWKSNRRQ